MADAEEADGVKEEKEPENPEETVGESEVKAWSDERRSHDVAGAGSRDFALDYKIKEYVNSEWLQGSRTGNSSWKAYPAQLS